MLSRNLWRVLEVYFAFFVLAMLYVAFLDGFYVGLVFLLIVLAGLGVWVYWLKKLVKPLLDAAGGVLNRSFLTGHEKIVLFIAVLPLAWVLLFILIAWLEGLFLAFLVLAVFYFLFKWLFGKIGVKSVFTGFEAWFLGLLKGAGFRFSSFLSVGSGNSLVLGRIVKVLRGRVVNGRRSVMEWVWVGDGGFFVLDPERELNRHGLVVGSSGTGKSNFLKVLTSRLCEVEKVHVVDPHGEYAKSFNGRVVKLGEQGLNPWSLDGKPASYRIHENVDVLSDVLDLGAQQTYFLTMAARNAFESKGFDLKSGKVEVLEPPSFEEVLIEAKKLEKKSSSVKTLCRRLESLLWSNLFPAEDSFNIGDLMKENVCFDASGVPTPGQKKLFTEIYLRKSYHTAVSTSREENLTIIIDEAEGLIINPDDYPGKSYESYADRLSAEARKFKIGLILGTQRCTALSKSLIQNAGFVISFYVQEPLDAKYVAKLLCGNSSDEWKLSILQETVNRLNKGECVAMSGVYKDPIFVKTGLFKESVVKTVQNAPAKQEVQKTLVVEKEMIKLPEVKSEVLLKKELEKGLNDKERKVLEHLKVHGSVSAKAYSDLIEVDRRTVDRYMEVLIDKGLIVKKGEGKNTTYYLKR